MTRGVNPAKPKSTPANTSPNTAETALPQEEGAGGSFFCRSAELLTCPLSELVYPRQGAGPQVTLSPSNTLMAELKAKQPGFFRTSYEVMKRVFTDNPGSSVAYSALQGAEAVLAVLPYFLLTNFISQAVRDPSPNELAWKGGGLVMCWAANSLVKGLSPTIISTFYSAAKRTIDRAVLENIHSRSESTIFAPGFSEIKTIKDNIGRNTDFIMKNFAICSSAMACTLAAVAMVKTSTLFATALAGIGVLELFSAIRGNARFEATLADIAGLMTKYWFRMGFATDREGILDFKGWNKSTHLIQDIDDRSKHIDAKRDGDVRKLSVEAVLIGGIAVLVKASLLVSLISNYVSGDVRDPFLIQNAILMAITFNSSLSSLVKYIGQQRNNLSIAAKSIAIGKVGHPDRIPDKIYERLDRAKAPMIAIKDVTYFPEGSDKPIIKNLTMTFEPGQIYGICGDSGAGKTTLVRLLRRHLIPTEGEITLNNIAINNVDPDDRRAAIGCLAQQYPTLKTYTVDEAIRVGADSTRNEAPLEDTLIAAKIDFTGEENEGLQSVIGGDVGNKGREFSGGENQRIALARVLFQESPFIILDEPTSQLGVQDEEMILRSIQELAKQKGRTVLLISHRYANLMGADKIYFLENGAVLEEGTHSELIALNGQYASRFRTESIRYTETLDTDTANG
jgi:ABC-type multidrug transport system fused ATPase/permease subunit